MKGFQFKFQPILKIKEMEEGRVQEEYLFLKKAHTVAEQKLNHLVTKKADHLAEIQAAEEEGTFDVTKAILYRDYISYLHQEITVASEEKDRCKEEMDQGFERLVDKTKERKILEKLKEKHKHSFVTEQLKMIQNELDDLAQGRFNHQKKQLEAKR